MAQQQTYSEILSQIHQPRLRSWTARMQAKDAASRVLGPLVPAGTLGWLAFPSPGESARRYAQRAVSTAAARSAWAGGLIDGTQAIDQAVRQSVTAILHR
jgi:hypothetical protein